MNKNISIQKIIISRTDAIGDVVLTLPLAGAIKKLHSKINITFLGRKYTKSIIAHCKFVDEFIDFDEIEQLPETKQIQRFQQINADAILHIFPNKKIANIAKEANILLRIGTRNRYYHWFLCNKLLNISRKNSNLHEAQLNLLFTQFLENRKIYDLSEIPLLYGFQINSETPKDDIFLLIARNKFNLVLHPKSKGSAKEWGIDNFNALINLLPKDKFRIFITGTENESAEIIENIDFASLQKNDLDIHNLIGKTSLETLIHFISKCDGLVAASTGVLHIAAMAGIHTVGLFPPIRPINPTRWMPIGKNANYFVKPNNQNCKICSKGNVCECMQSISPNEIANFLINVNQN